MAKKSERLLELVETPPWEWPEETAAIVREVLADPASSEQDLLNALHVAGDITVMSDEMAEVLLSLVRNGDAPERVRAGAAIALGPTLELAFTDGFDEMSDVAVSQETFERVQKVLRSVYTDASAPKLVRRRALEGSVRAPEDWHRDATRAAWGCDDPEWRVTAVFCMQQIKGFEPQIIKALKDKSPEIRLEAVRAAGEWSIAAAWPVVASIVTHPPEDKQLLLAAIDAVASIRPNEAPTLLLELSDSPDEDIAEAVEEALSMAEGLAGLDEFEEDEDDEEDEGPLH